MTRADWLLAGLFTLGSFVLCVLWVQFPPQKIFDEVYYARAGEEYLKNLNVSGWGPFEFTHPPLTKLVITLSMLLFGGLHGGGDTALGWRFLNVVVGALMVGLLYAFAKRLTSSTLFASLAAAMLALDGFHFTQSRIATPEITVAVPLAADAVRVLSPLAGHAGRAPRADAGGSRVGARSSPRWRWAWSPPAPRSFAAPHLGPIVMGTDWQFAAQMVLAIWTLVLFWLIGRVVVVPRFSAATEVSYADGTRLFVEGAAKFAETP